jgi:DNA-binding response OmpR family regulator
VVLAPNGNRCLEEMRKGFAGVVLMDIMMPGLSGWQTIRALARENLLQNVLVCMLTARATPGPESEGMEEFVFDYLPKPFDFPTLIHCVDNAAGFLPS